MKKLKVLTIILSLIFFVAIRILIFRYIPIEGLDLSSPFIADLLGKGVTTPYLLIVLSDVVNLFLIWIIARKFLGNNYGFLAPVFYAISPWPAYLTIDGSIFIFVLTGTLLFYLGIMLMEEKRKFLGVSLASLGVGVMIYSNLSMFFVLPFLILGIYFGKLFTKKDCKFPITILIILMLPIVLLSLIHRNNLRGDIAKNISLFDGVGLINSVNTFRGEARNVGYPHLGILVENKITYLGRRVIFNALTALSPYTYFTQQFKLLGFSFTPPIFLGLLIPCLYGLVSLINKKHGNYHLLWLTLPFLIPAILREYFPDLTSLILILPTIIFISAWGMGELIRNRKLAFIVITVFLIFLQGVTSIYDITTREPIRYRETIQANK